MHFSVITSYSPKSHFPPCPNVSAKEAVVQNSNAFTVLDLSAMITWMLLPLKYTGFLVGHVTKMVIKKQAFWMRSSSSISFWNCSAQNWHSFPGEVGSKQNTMIVLLNLNPILLLMQLNIIFTLSPSTSSHYWVLFSFWSAKTPGSFSHVLLLRLVSPVLCLCIWFLLA